MTVYYLQVLTDNLSIELDSDIHYHHCYKVDDIIKIHMYSDKGPKVVFGVNSEYDAQFTLDWNKKASARLSISSCITKGILADITKSVLRQEKLLKLGI